MIPLPLPTDVTRCLGHWEKKGESCRQADQCARHVTIRHDDELWEQLKPAHYRACADHRFLARIPIHEAAIPATISYPMGSMGEAVEWSEA